MKKIFKIGLVGIGSFLLGLFCGKLVNIEKKKDYVAGDLVTDKDENGKVIYYINFDTDDLKRLNRKEYVTFKVINMAKNT